MSNILRSDLYRFGKSKLFYGIAVVTGIIALSLVMMIRQDVHFGISVFGDLTAFKTLEDVIQIGVKYQKGLGILVAVLISVFIGQEYQWKTWQHKWVIIKSRIRIYFSKALLSSAVSATVFLIFEMVALLCSGQIREILTSEYAAMILCSVFIYAALGAVICLLSMIIKNNTSSIIVCLGYVLFSETLVSIIKNVSSISIAITKLAEWGIEHSIYGMSSIISGTSDLTGFIATILMNSLVIMLLSATIGLLFFQKYEL